MNTKLTVLTKGVELNRSELEQLMENMKRLEVEAEAAAKAKAAIKHGDIRIGITSKDKYIVINRKGLLDSLNSFPNSELVQIRVEDTSQCGDGRNIGNVFDCVSDWGLSRTKKLDTK